MLYRFGEFSLDSDRLELSKGDTLLTVQPQVFSLLTCLIENRDRVVSKDEVFDIVWNGQIVSDGTLNARVNAARKVLGDTGKDQSIIRTIPRKGFRFIAEVIVDGSDSIAKATPVQIDKPSIAVLPFTNLSNDPEQEYFSDGISEDIITDLSHVRQLFVISRNSTFNYKGTSTDIRQVAKELGVRYVLEGSVRKAGKRLRITAQLINGETGSHIWAERYDRNFDDIFEIQDEITKTVIGAIQPELSRAEQQRARTKSSENLDAWDLFQRGIWHCWRNSEYDLIEARKLFRSAIDLDEEFSQAYAYLAFTIWRTVVFRFAEVEDLVEAFTAAKKALDIDGGDAIAHWAMGVVHMQRRDLELAIEEYEKAISINPSFANAYQFLGWAMVYDKRPDEGIRQELEAQRLSPNDPSGWGMTLIQAQAHIILRDFEEAAKLANQVRQQVMSLPVICVLLTCYGYLGQTDETEQLIEALNQLDPNFTTRTIAAVFPFRHQADIDIWVEGLRKAGVSD